MSTFCAAVDWGTSSFRLWLLDAQGNVLGERRSNEGVAQIQSDGFADVLKRHLTAIGAAPDIPVIMCGMAGSRQGWAEAGYLDVPCRLEDILGRATVINEADSKAAGQNLRILPGLAQRNPLTPDVMRGEETQLLGCFGIGASDGLACLPGTHSKWVNLHDGRLTGFQTFMTGELFAAISRHTILSHEFGGNEIFNEAVFEEAAGHSICNPAELTAALFSIRAGSLLGFSSSAHGLARLSGLLIGSEIGLAREKFGTGATVDLVAQGDLASHYSSALHLAGFTVRTHDSEEAVRRGLFAAARQYWTCDGGKAF